MMATVAQEKVLHIEAARERKLAVEHCRSIATSYRIEGKRAQDNGLKLVAANMVYVAAALDVLAEQFETGVHEP
jgi:hypothetical protein